MTHLSPIEADPAGGAWSLAVPDWPARIVGGRSLLPDLPLFAAEADRALAIFKRLRVPDLPGQPTFGAVSAPWVFDLVRAIFGSYDPVAQVRHIREAFLLLPKGNGKTTIAAAILVVAVLLNRRRMAEALMIAPTQKIAKNAFKQARGIIRADPDLDKLFLVQDHQLQMKHRLTEAVIVIKAFSTETVTGGMSVFVLVDETHELAREARAEEVMVELRGAIDKRPEGFLMQITTQSKEPPRGLFERELKRARAVRDGKLALPILPILYELPAALQADGGWKDEATWALVNPNLGRSVHVRDLRNKLMSAQEDGAAQMALIASQHFNVEIGVGLRAEGWAGAPLWDAATVPGLTLEAILERCDACTVGVDGGGLDDLGALYVIGRDAEAGEWLGWGRAWAQPEVLVRRKDIASKLEDLMRDGDLVLCAEANQHFAEMAAICETIRDAGKLPGKDCIGLDRWGIKELVRLLAARGIVDEVVGVGQGYQLQPSVLTLPLMLKGLTFRPAAQRLLAWAVGNTKQELRGSNWIITKAAAGSAKIDPVIAMFNAAFLMIEHPPAAAPEPRVRSL